MEGADDQAFFDCTLDFEDGPPVGSEEDLLPDDGRGGTEEQRRGAIAAMRERVMKDSSAG